MVFLILDLFRVSYFGIRILMECRIVVHGRLVRAIRYPSPLLQAAAAIPAIRRSGARPC